ncbi:MAG: heavy metal-associated domain-containing protein [Verrucomicrobia bacterium]|nr:heavy metal-associated domain-containing protein [Verrucomicrobiota bacterium]
MAEAIIDTNGANCPGCRRAIERSARRLDGVKSCRVDIATREIHVDYNGSDTVIQAIVDLVDKLGYVATPRTEPASQ